MKALKRKSLVYKIILIVSIIIVIVFSAQISISTIFNRKKAIKDTENLIYNNTNFLALKIVGLVNNAFNTLEVETESIIMLDNQNIIDKQTVLNIIDLNLKRNTDFTGMCLIFEPNTLCKNDYSYPELMDKGNFIPYLFFDANKKVGIAPLVDYDVEGLGDYYLIPKKTNKQLLTEPYLYPVNNIEVLMITLVNPIIKKGDFVGIVTADYDVKFVQKFSKKMKDNTYDGNINISVISNEGYFVANTSNSSFIGKNIKDCNIENYEKSFDVIKSKKTNMEYLNDSLVVSIPIQFGDDYNYWLIQTKIPKDIIYQKANTQTIISIISGLIALVISIVILILFISKNLNPIKKLTEINNKLSTGNFNIEIDIKQNDEIGQLADSLADLIKNFKEIISQIRSASTTVLGAGNQLTSASQQISESANEQAATTEEISASMEQILQMINSNVENAEKTDVTTKHSTEKMQQSSAVFMKTIDSISEISDKIGIISEIANKTDILSINAAIEAARAGESGKGFAVVANEIRKLADKTKVASEKINELSQSGQDISEIAGKELSEVIPEILKSSKLIENIVIASKEQQSGVKSINISLQQLTQITNQNSASAEQMSASAEQLLAQAEQLKEIISIFQIDK